MAIPQAYIRDPKHANIMAQMLQARLGYAKLEPKGLKVSGGSGKSGATTFHDKRAAKKAKKASVKTAQAQAEANVMKTKAATQEMKARGEEKRTAAEEQRAQQPSKNKMAKEKHKSAMLDALADRTKTVMGNLGKWMPQVTQENYRDIFNFGRETLGDSVGSFMANPDEIEGMSPVEWKVAHSKLSGALESPSDKKARGVAAKGVEIEKKRMAKDKTAARKEYIRIQGVLDRVRNTGGFSPEIFAMLSPEMQTTLQGTDREEYTGLLEEYSQQLMDEYGFKFKTKEDDRPPPGEHEGKIIRDIESGKRFKSDGKNWNEVK